MEGIKARIWASGGGKGGVGKSFIASNLACALALKGNRVVLIDADLTGANLHTLFGIRIPKQTLGDFISKKVATIEEVLTPTGTHGLSLICGAGDILELANPKYTQKRRLIRAIGALEADYIIIDIGAGASLNNLDFFNMADMGFIVTSPTPTSIQNAYGFMKMAINRKIISMFAGHPEQRAYVTELLEGEKKKNSIEEFLTMLGEFNAKAASVVKSALDKISYKLIVNMGTESEGQKISKAISSAANQFLNLNLNYLGFIEHSRDIEMSIRAMKPLVLTAGAASTQAVMRIAEKSIGVTRATKDTCADHIKIVAPDSVSSSSMQLGLNNDIVYEGKSVHIQTEDLGLDKKQILTLVYSDGQILFSKNTPYSDLKHSVNQQKAIQEQVNWQHRAVIAGIKNGKLKDKILN